MSTPSQQTAVSEISPAVRVVPFGNKGLGIQATKDIPVGSLIASEEPLLTGPKILLADPAEFEKLALQFSLQLQARPPEDQLRLLALANAHDDAPLLYGIYRTNAIPMSKQNRGGVFPTICRMNHSCVPNCVYSWNDRIKREVTYTVVDVKKGDEITVSYTKALPSSSERQAILMSQWGFKCQCEVCSLDDSAREASDAARLSLSQMINTIPITLGTEPVRALELANKSLEIIERERLFGLKASVYFDAFQTCALWSDKKHAKIWAQKAADAYAMIRGCDYEQVERMRRLTRDPKTYILWGSSGRQTLS